MTNASALRRGYQAAVRGNRRQGDVSRVFHADGATVHDVELMRKAVGPEMGVKASGGVKTYEDAAKMIQAGATRIGASAGVKIIQGPGGAKEAGSASRGF